LAQALLCLSDSLRVGDDTERREAVVLATDALATVEGLAAPYNLPRAYHYLALAEEAQDRLPDAVRWWERSLDAARTGGNRVIEPLVLMNLGATLEKLGDRERAVDFLRQSARGFEALGDQARAAENLFNVGAMLVGYGGDADEGVRNVNDAVEVFRDLGNRSFEVRAAHVMSTYYRSVGRYAEAEQELNRALSMSGERDLDFGAVITSIRLAQTRMDVGDYEGARQRLTSVLPKAPARRALEARLHLARAYLRLGSRVRAGLELEAVSEGLDEATDRGLSPLLETVTGELAEEAGRPAEARSAYSRASMFAAGALPDLDALGARAQYGWFEAASGRIARGRSILHEVLGLARRIGHRSVEARCLLLLARVEIAGGRAREAIALLEQVPPDEGGRSIERELRADVRYWTAEAWSASGDTARASEAQSAARAIVASIEGSLRENDRPAFRARPPIARILSR
jgi:tetratricopeptide (TPR) repeat protein